jgi:hypothetical protein
MTRRSALLPIALAAALVAAAPAAAKGGPVAHAAGGDAPLPLPSIVATRVTRTENALDRLTKYVDNDNLAGVTRTGKVIRRQLSAAWRGAVYYVKNAPAPPPGDFARAPARHFKGGAVPGAIADPYTTAFGVFTLQHEVAATIAELTDGASATVLNTMSRTLFYTLDSRDKAVATAQKLQPPVIGGDARVHARRFADAPPPSFATVMPQVPPQLDDEIQQIAGLLSDATDLAPGGKKVLKDAMVQTLLTEHTINTIWPPVVGDG